MFPGKSAGVALVFLRLCTIGGLALSPTPLLSNTGGWQHYLSVITVIAVVLGVFTPVAGSVVLILEACSLKMNAAALGTLLYMVITVSLLLLGPGAYSIDAILFGRRRILPPQE